MQIRIFNLLVFTLISISIYPTEGVSQTSYVDPATVEVMSANENAANSNISDSPEVISGITTSFKGQGVSHVGVYNQDGGNGQGEIANFTTVRQVNIPETGRVSMKMMQDAFVSQSMLCAFEGDCSNVDDVTSQTIGNIDPVTLASVRATMASRKEHESLGLQICDNFKKACRDTGDLTCISEFENCVRRTMNNAPEFSRGDACMICSNYTINPLNNSLTSQNIGDSTDKAHQLQQQRNDNSLTYYSPHFRDKSPFTGPGEIAVGDILFPEANKDDCIAFSGNQLTSYTPQELRDDPALEREALCITERKSLQTFRDFFGDTIIKEKDNGGASGIVNGTVVAYVPVGYKDFTNDPDPVIKALAEEFENGINLYFHMSAEHYYMDKIRPYMLDACRFAAKIPDKFSDEGKIKQWQVLFNRPIDTDNTAPSSIRGHPEENVDKALNAGEFFDSNAEAYKALKNELASPGLALNNPKVLASIFHPYKLQTEYSRSAQSALDAASLTKECDTNLMPADPNSSSGGGGEFPSYLDLYRLTNEDANINDNIPEYLRVWIWIAQARALNKMYSFVSMIYNRANAINDIGLRQSILKPTLEKMIPQDLFETRTKQLEAVNMIIQRLIKSMNEHNKNQGSGRIAVYSKPKSITVTGESLE